MRGRRWIVPAGCLGVLVVIGLLINAWINAQVDTFYSPDYHSDSTSEAKASGVLVAELALEQPSVRWDGVEYPVEEAWIERQIRAEHRWLFFRTTRTIGYRLLVRFPQPPPHTGRRPISDLLIGASELTANDTVHLLSWTGGPGYELAFAPASPPFPRKLRLRVRTPKNGP